MNNLAGAFLSSFKPDIQYCDPDVMQQLNHQMQPGGCSQEGFLAHGQDLTSVCAKDAEYLKSRGITHEQIADRLEAILTKAQFLLFKKSNSTSSLQRTALIQGKFAVPLYLSTLGEQECPFSINRADRNTWCGKCRSEITIINTVSQKRLKNITEMHAHDSRPPLF